MTAVGYVTAEGKTSKQLRDEIEKKKQAELINQKRRLASSLGIDPSQLGIPDGPPSGPSGHGHGGHGHGSHDEEEEELMEKEQAFQNSRAAHQAFQRWLIKAEELKMAGMYEHAAECFIQALGTVPPGQSEETLVGLGIMASSCYLEAGKYPESLKLLQSLYQIIAPNAITARSMIQRHMFRVLIASGNHDDAETIIRGVIASSRQEGGEETKVHAGDLTSLGIVLKSKGEYEAARECFASAIEICKNILAKETSPKASSELTDMLYGIYMEFEDTLLYQNDFEGALNHLRQVEAEAKNPPDIFLGWHWCEVAYVLITHGEFSEAETLLRRVIATFAVAEEKSLVSKAYNYLGNLVYNLGRHEEAEELFAVIRENKWGILNSSQYLSTKTATIQFERTPADEGFVGKYTFSLELRKKPSSIPVGSLLEISIENSESEPEVTEIEVTSDVLRTGKIEYESKGYHLFKKGCYTFITKIWNSPEKTEVLHTHFQFCPSNMDTTNISKWRELAGLFSDLIIFFFFFCT